MAPARTRVRVIDDDEEICREISCALAMRGYDADWSNSLPVRTHGQERPIDVLVLDLGLPGTDGFQIIEALVAADQRPDIIVASGYDGRIIRAAVRSAEAAGMRVLGALEKPYATTALVELIESRRHRAEPFAADESALVQHLAETGALADTVRTAFQSKRRLSNGAVIGYEALLRLSHDGREIRPEAAFGPGVELDVQLAVTAAVLDDAMRFASVLKAAGQSAPVAVNCTPPILCHPTFPLRLARALDDWCLAPAAIQIEITEHESATSFDRLAAAASRLALRDCRIAVDDFGRGAASFERLTDLPLTELKIDKALFWNCAEGKVPMAMIEEIIRYCADNGILSVVEGIETARHRDCAIAAGANAGQGFLWDRPAIPSRITLAA